MVQLHISYKDIESTKAYRSGTPFSSSLYISEEFFPEVSGWLPHIEAKRWSTCHCSPSSHGFSLSLHCGTPACHGVPEPSSLGLEHPSPSAVWTLLFQPWAKEPILGPGSWTAAVVRCLRTYWWFLVFFFKSLCCTSEILMILRKPNELGGWLPVMIHPLQGVTKAHYKLTLPRLTCFPELDPPALPPRRSFTSWRRALRAASTMASAVLPPTGRQGTIKRTGSGGLCAYLTLWRPAPLHIHQLHLMCKQTYTHVFKS